jgi:hypothetical protein
MSTITKRATGYQVQIRRKGFPTFSKMFASKRDAEAWATRQFTNPVLKTCKFQVDKYD